MLKSEKRASYYAPNYASSYNVPRLSDYAQNYAGIMFQDLMGEAER